MKVWGFRRAPRNPQRGSLPGGGVSGFHLVAGRLVGERKRGGEGLTISQNVWGRERKMLRLWSAYLMVEESNEVRGRGSLSKRTRGSGSRVVTDDYM